MKLYQKTKKDGVKFLDFKTDGPKFITTWGLVGGKTQTSTKICKAMNVGRSNETTPEQQAKLEMEAKIAIKMKEGYSKSKPEDGDTIVQAHIDLDNIPESFCPNKPIAQKNCPKSVLENVLTYGQRKRNGHCLFIVKGKTTEKVYTRRMEDITQYVKDLPAIKDAMSRVKKGSFDMFECTYFHKGYGKEMPRFVAQVIRKENAAEAMSRYKELSKDGFFSMYPIDTLFQDYKFVGSTAHLDRIALMKKNEKLVGDVILTDWAQQVEYAKTNSWEGFVLRVPGEKSYISYTMDGTAHKAGSWKYKFTQEDDFVIDMVMKGKSGKHANFYAKFHLSQYDAQGNIIDRGYCGTGTLTHDDLVELTIAIDSKKCALPFVVEVEYQSIHDESGKLEFPQIMRLRADKIATDCVSSE